MDFDGYHKQRDIYIYGSEDSVDGNRLVEL
jgi:hypothetical protein